MHEVVCAICGSTERRVIHDRGRNNEQVTNVICQKCGFVYINPRPETPDIHDVYTKGVFTINARGSNIPSRSKVIDSEKRALRRFRLMSDLLKLESVSAGKMLEIGCGLGSFLRLGKGLGWDVIGLEPDPTYAEFAQHRYQLDVQPDIYETVDFPAESFDVVAFFHVLEHVESPRQFLGRVRSHLKPGGHVFVEVPTIEYPLEGDLDRFFWSVHLSTFSTNTLTGLLQDLGFRIIETGFANDALWVMAEKADDVPKPMFPLDDPRRVWLQAHKRYRRFKRLQGLTGHHHMLEKGLSVYRKASSKIRNEPEDFVPTVRRVSSHWRVNAFTRLPIVKIPKVLMRGRYLAHYGLHKPSTNAGDTQLFQTVRSLFDATIGPHNWSLEPLWPEVQPKTIARLNRESRGVVIGGGGLLLPDTNPNENSGWQWNCSLENLQKIEVPLINFAIGYNRFRKQKDFAPIFKPHIQETIRRSAFFGLRNYGSIRSLKPYLDGDPELEAKLTFQPCQTTLLRHLFPYYRKLIYQEGVKRLALNIAFDRHHLRFGQREDDILTDIARAIKWAEQSGWDIVLAIHSPRDANIIPWLIRERVAYREVSLVGQNARTIRDFYAEIPLTIGMRGHSQMIPFGMGGAIISLISHNKMGYFLEDIRHREWGVDIREENLETRLREKIQYLDDNRPQVQEELLAAQQELWQITLKNMAQIKEALQ